MTAAWPTIPLGQLVDGGELSYGIVQPGGAESGGVPIVRVKDLNRGSVDTRSALRVAPSVSARHSRTVLRGGEVLVSVVGTVGETAVVTQSLAGWNVARAIAVVRPKGVSPQWIRLALQTGPVQNTLKGVLNTTVQATLNLADLKRLRIPMPPEPTRKAIVDMLGALDDKIAANDRQLRLAEQLADTLHLAVAREAHATGLTFDDVAEVGGGGTPRTSVDEYWGGDISWATPTDITALRAPYLNATSRTITDAGLQACASSLYPVGSILMTSRATIGAFAIAEVPLAVNQGFIVVNAKNPAFQWWLFHEMRSRVQEFLAYANGATFLELPRGRFKTLALNPPSTYAVRKFDEAVRPLHVHAALVVHENGHLDSARDELLPLLMSGELSVKDADHVVEGIV